MNIWIINHYSGSSRHGMEYRHYYIAQELKNQGHSISIIASSFSHLHATIPNIDGKITYEEIDDIRYAWIKTNKYQGNGLKRIINMLLFSLRLFMNTKNLKLNRPDAIIATSPHPFVFLNGIHLKKKFEAKLISEVRDIWPLTIVKMSRLSNWNPLIMLMNLSEWLAYRYSDYLVSLLPTAFKHMHKKGLTKEKFKYIPNGVLLDQKSSDLPSEITNQIPENKFIVGYAGTFGLANALEHFVQAAIDCTNKDIHFILVGDGFTKENLQKMSTQTSNITFIPRVRKEFVQTIIKKFDVCYIGLQRDDLFQYGISPNKIFDYMFAEKPILMAIEAGNDLVNEAQCGISIPAQDSPSINNAIEIFFQMPPDQRISLGKNGKEFLLKNHTYQIIATKFLELLK